MTFRRRRSREGFNVFVVFTDMLFAMVFILLLQVLCQGLAARTEAESSLRKQREAVKEAVEQLIAAHPGWRTAFLTIDQHESLQRIKFSETMTFAKDSSDINQLPTDLTSGVQYKNRKAIISELARALRTSLPANSTVEIQGFYGPGESETVANDRAVAVMRIFRDSGFPGFRLLATSHGTRVPRAYGYGLTPPRSDWASKWDRRIEILIISRRVTPE